MSQTERADDYTTHIRHTRCELEWRNKAWCGSDIQYQFAFGSADHAAYTAQSGGRLVPCAKCIEAFVRALQSQSLGSALPSDVTRRVSDVTKAPFAGDKVLVPGYTRVFVDD